MSDGLLLLRVVVGGTMAGHGAQKLLGWFDGPGLGGVRKMLGSFGFRWPALLVLLTVAVAVSATGPGRFSIDRALRWDDNLSGLWWGVGVIGGAAVRALLTLNLGRRRERLRQAAAA